MCMKSCNQQSRLDIPNLPPDQENYTFVQRLGWMLISLCSFGSTFPSGEEEKFEGALNSCVK